jgi:quercetin dioxygenase-like cupin family protein
MESCPIKSTQRQRVLSSHGPRRTEVTECVSVDNNVTPKFIDAIKNITNTYVADDLGGDLYKISKTCESVESFKGDADSNYRQIVLQKLPEGKGVEMDETLYTEWRDDIDCTEIKKYFDNLYGEGKYYRARISVMAPGHELNWHIDTDTSILCRTQTIVQSFDSYFEAKNRQGVQSYKLEEGNTYFINQGWPHRVVNNDKWRIVVIAGVYFKDIPGNEKVLVQ